MSLSVAISKCLKTIGEMLQDRGRIDESVFVTNQITEFQNNQSQIFSIDLESKIRIIFNLSAKFKVHDIKKYIEPHFDSYILVIREKITTTNKKTIHEINADIEVFDIRELLFNITKHSLVPKHTLIVSEDEINELVTKFQVKTRYQLPVILKSDPIARYINAKPGNLVKITRYSPSSGEHIIYRCCM